jgi:uncharacterized DUF497 family protein
VSLERVLFDWDDGNIRHLARHNVSPHEAEECYRNDPLLIEEQLISGEGRYLALSETDAMRRLAFVFTIRQERIRIITAYPMTIEQQIIYEEG